MQRVNIRHIDPREFPQTARETPRIERDIIDKIRIGGDRLSNKTG